ncbi:hypothetical protein [Micromonospora profundi]|uniref:hypothetical protein n=1 Tax=Micromonospora profundi TaxID=1420889 RepID=UPI0036678949
MTAPPVRRLTAEFDTLNDANHWLDTIPAGWRMLASQMNDLRDIPGGKIVVEATVTPDPFTLADVKAAFAGQGMSIDPLGGVRP